MTRVDLRIAKAQKKGAGRFAPAGPASSGGGRPMNNHDIPAPMMTCKAVVA
jgi:hypothetical protein